MHRLCDLPGISCKLSEIGTLSRGIAGAGQGTAMLGKKLYTCWIMKTRLECRGLKAGMDLN